ncbi:hypothetical protein [Streptomyces olivoreticuli]|uniref:hypothetical protein n=1 Tax=Streptomyces olivoreticuli TaxID=68246 RepID=UPI0013C2F3FB|nr:hypothetical protein [Streptomyces olivoreticuli]
MSNRATRKAARMNNRAAIALGAGAFIAVLGAGAAQAATAPAVKTPAEHTAQAKPATDRKALIKQAEKHLAHAKANLDRIQRGIRNGTLDADRYALALEMYGKDVTGLTRKYDELREGKAWDASQIPDTERKLRFAEANLKRIQQGIRNGTYSADEMGLALEMYGNDVIGLTYKLDDIRTGGLKR